MKKSSRRYNVKHKFIAAVAMLVVAATLLTAVSFAWLVLSTAPEVTGIRTNIGSNGALEIVLLNGQTYQDPSRISTAIGSTDSWEANFRWSNLVDLNYDDAGLNEILLLPARLNLAASDPNRIKDATSILSVPTYDDNGQVIAVTNNTLAAIYSKADGSFMYDPSALDYGVRAIGTSNQISTQASAIMSAKSNIKTYINSARSAAANAISRNGNGLIQILVVHSGNNSFDSTHLDTVEAMVTGLTTSTSYIENTIRQGLIVVAASQLADVESFEAARFAINSAPLSDIVSNLDNLNINAGFRTWIADLLAINNNLNDAIGKIEELRSKGTYTWEEIRGVLDTVIKLDGAHLNGTAIGNLDPNTILNSPQKKLTLGAGSGAFADIANFVGDYNANIDSALGNISVEVFTNLEDDAVYLTALSSTVKDLEAAGGNAATGKVALENTYGYVIDLGFRTNANLSDLLLQTEGIQRIYEDAIDAGTMGGGSSMKFNTNEFNLDDMEVLHLADAVRVAFVTSDGSILGIAKLNTSNYKFADDTTIEIPLYLYDYSVSDDGALVMGERREDDNTLTALDRNVTKAVSVVVWLDGDCVDNTMVSAEEETSFSGLLNLQFASSADLVPAGIDHLKNLSGDKSDLEEKVETAKETYEAGQGTYTTKSWRDFAVAYTAAQSVMNDAQANERVVYNANKKLATATAALEKVSKSALQDDIDSVREQLGKTTDIARIVVENNGRYVGINTYTDEQFTNNAGIIYRVDYNKNLKDEGNGIMTQLYTDESWQALAATLYEAEILALDPAATEREIDDAITALYTLNNALERKVFYIPYVMDNGLYYKAIVADDTDKYGVWYDSNFKRIMNEYTMIVLDGKAEELNAATITMATYFKVGSTDSITNISVAIDKAYEKLFAGQSIIAVRWNMPSIFNSGATAPQLAEITELKTWASAYIADEKNTLYRDEITLNNEANADNMTYSEAEFWIMSMQRYKAMCEVEDPKAAPADTDPMTFNQRVVLTKSISAAKAIENYSEKTDLKAEIEAAEALLNNAAATVADAKAQLTELNTQITAAGGTVVTEASPVEYVIPVGTEKFDVAYGTLANNTTHTAVTVAENAHGEGEVTAVILTDKGVVMRATKSASVYYASAGVEISKKSVTLPADTSTTLDVELLPNNVNNTVEEQIDSVVWSTNNSAVATAEFSGVGQTCTIKGVAAGPAKVTVSVTTVQGNTYTATIDITVS